MADLVAWLDEQIAAHQARMAGAESLEDEAFFDGMIDAFRLVKRHVDIGGNTQ